MAAIPTKRFRTIPKEKTRIFKNSRAKRKTKDLHEEVDGTNEGNQRNNGTMKKLIKLDLSYGDLPQGHAYIRPKGFDHLKFPWNLKNESVEEAYSGFLLPHIKGEDRLKFFDELHRVLIKAGKATIIVPYWSHPKSTIHPCFKPPLFSELSFYIYNKEWRTSQGMKNTCKCDFDFSWGYNLEPETQNKNTETQQFHIRHYVNTVADLHVFLTKR